MKFIPLTVLSLSLSVALCGAAVAQGRYDHRDDPGSDTTRSDIARVVRVDRIAGGREPILRQECWNEQTRSHESGYYRDENGRLYRGDGKSSNTKSAVIGALVGGLIGNQVGSGDGKKAATVAGAAIGAAVGAKQGRENDRYEGDGYDRYRDNAGVERRCRTVEDYARTGPNLFRVTYVYAGQSYETTTRENPGRNLRVVVDVRPEDGEMAHRR